MNVISNTSLIADILYVCRSNSDLEAGSVVTQEDVGTNWDFWHPGELAGVCKWEFCSWWTGRQLEYDLKRWKSPMTFSTQLPAQVPGWAQSFLELREALHSQLYSSILLFLFFLHILQTDCSLPSFLSSHSHQSPYTSLPFPFRKGTLRDDNQTWHVKFNNSRILLSLKAGQSNLVGGKGYQKLAKN